MGHRIRTWVYASRPHTLGASITPMLVVLGALIHDGTLRWVPYLLCLFVAVSAQVASNLANDYFDFVGGQDTDERVGFERLLTTGEVTAKEMLRAVIITMSLCAVAGLTLAALCGWELLLIGLFVLLGVIGYSAGPFPLSHYGMGEVAVLLFYGLVPILASYYAIAGTIPTYLIWLAIGVGAWGTNIMVVNNYRDYDEDLQTGKGTLIVRLGRKWGPILYLVNSVITLTTTIYAFYLLGRPLQALLLGFLYLILFARGNLLITRLEGGQLNALLKQTSTTSLIVGGSILLSLIV